MTALAASLVAYTTEVCQAQRVEVAWLGVTAGDGVPLWSGDPCRAHPELRLVLGQGDDVDVLTVRPRLGIWVAAPVAASPAAVGSVVLVVDGTARIEDLGHRLTGPVIATRTIRAGEVVNTSNARSQPDVAAGTTVRVRVRIGALEIVADGLLLDAGRIGESVRAQNLATDAVVRGTLVDLQTVEL